MKEVKKKKARSVAVYVQIFSLNLNLIVERDLLATYHLFSTIVCYATLPTSVPNILFRCVFVWRRKTIAIYAF